MINDISSYSEFFPDKDYFFHVLRRLNLLPSLIRRREEEAICELVNIESSWIDSAVEASLGKKV